MRKLLGHQVGHRDIEEIIRDVDLNGDGRVDFEGRWGLKVGEKVAVHGALQLISIMQPSIHSQFSVPTLPSCQSSIHATLQSVSHLYIHPSRLFIHPSLHLSRWLFIHSSICRQLSIEPSINARMCSPTHLLILKFTQTFIRAPIHPCTSLHAPVRLHISFTYLCL